MRVLITGVTGIVGRNLLPLLLEDPDISEVVGISRKATFSWSFCDENKKYVERYADLSNGLPDLKAFNPNIIYNLAAVATTNTPAIGVWKNTSITLNLLEECRNLNRPVKFIQASSINVENEPSSVYTCSKRACEDLVESYNQLYENITGYNIRFCAVVGANNNHGLLADIVRKLRAEGDTIELFGEHPGSCKPYIYVKHLAPMLKYPFFPSLDQTHLKEGGTFTICPYNTLNVLKIVKIAMEKMNVSKKILWNASKVWKGDQRWVAQNHKDVWDYYPEKRKLTSEQAIELALDDILEERRKLDE